MKDTLFICYSRKDENLSLKFKEAVEKAGKEAWIDQEDLPASYTWRDEIKSAITGSVAFIYLISANSINSEYCQKEYEFAKQLNKRIFPILLPGTTDKEIPESVSSYQWLKWEDFGEKLNVNKLITDIETDYEWVKFITELGVKASRWEKQQDNSRLIRGKELREAEQQLASAGTKLPQPTDAQRKYILVSQRHEERQRRKTIIGLSFGMLVMTALSLFAWNQTNKAIKARETAIAQENARATAQTEAEEQARIAKSRELAIDAKYAISDQLDTALLLAIQSYKIHHSLQSQSALLESLNKTINIEKIVYAPEFVDRLAISPESTRLIAYSTQNPIFFMWDLTKTHPNIIDSGESKIPISYITFLLDPKEIFFGFENGDMLMKSVETEESLILQDHNASIEDIKILPDLTLLSADSNGYILVWDLANNSKYDFTFKSERLNSIDFDSKFVVMLGANGEIIVWDYRKNKIISHFSIDSKPLRVLLGKGNQIITSGENISIWTMDGKYVKTIWDHNTVAIAFNQEIGVIAASTLSGSIVIFDANTYEILKKLEIGHSTAIRDIKFSKNNLVSVSDEGKIIIWNINRDISENGELVFEGKNFNKPKFSKNGDLLAIGNNETMIILDIQSGKVINELKIGEYISSEVDFSPTAPILAMGSSRGNLFLWDFIENKKILQKNISLDSPITSLKFDTSGRKLAISRFDGGINIFDLNTQANTYLYNNILSPATDITFLADNNKIAVLHENGHIFIWDILTQAYSERVAFDGRLTINAAFSLDYSPNSDLLIFTLGIKPASIIVNDTNNFSYFGFPKFLSTGQVKDGGIGIIESNVLPAAYAIGLSNDSNLMAVQSPENFSLQLWDINTRSLIGELIGHRSTIYGIDIGLDNTTIVSSSYDWKNDSSKVILWDTNPESWIQSMCGKLNRNLTRSEWDFYIGETMPYEKTCLDIP